MDPMDIDHAVFIPDTPVRLATQGTTTHGKSSDVGDENRRTSIPCHSRQQKSFVDGVKDHPIAVDRGRRGLSPVTQKCNGSSSSSPQLVTSTALPLASPSSSGNSYLSQNDVTGKKPSLNNASTNAPGVRSRRALCISKSSSRDDSFVDLTERNLHRHINRKDSSNGERKKDQNENDFQQRSEVPSLASSWSGMTSFPNASSNHSMTDNMNKVGTSIGSGGASTGQNESGCGGFPSAHPIARVNKQRRLVRNGCISPNNIAKAKQLDGININCSSNAAHNSSGSMGSNAPVSIDIMELVAEDNNSHTRKGKEVVNHPGPSKGPDHRNKNLQSRNSLRFDEKAVEMGDYIRRPGKSFDESDGWRSINKRTADIYISSSPDKERHLVRETDGPRCSSQHQDNIPHPRVRLGRLNGTRSAAKAHIRRQKLGSASSSHGESSTSVSNDSEVVLLSSSAEAANPKSASSSAGNLPQIIEVADLSPQPRPTSHDEDARARQVEADELLARELQEQFYSEVPAFGVTEIDEHIARALQQQDDLNPSFSRTRRPASNARGSSVFNLRRQSQSRSSSNTSCRGTRARSSTLGRPTRLRSRFPGQPHTLLPSRERTSMFPENMDIETRMHILGTLEEISDMRRTTAMLQAQRDFNENDYEMLLALDDNNHHGGASIHQINGLPQSTVQSDNFEEACAICLETPTIGDTIRHLPCLHKFHKECIDPWLRRKTSCPVCKCSIT